MIKKPRVAITALSISAAALVGHIWPSEGWTETAVVPVKGDVPTVGPGLTKRPDGSPVRLGDRVTPLEGAARSLAHIQKDEGAIKRCVTAPINQDEYDLLVDFAYQYGAGALCSSSIVRNINRGNYATACEGYLAYRLVRAEPGEKGGPGFVRGADGVLRFDCSTLINGKPNRRCWGVWQRSQGRYEKCREALT